MFTVFAKHFVTGTVYEDMTVEAVNEIMRKWDVGEDITVQGKNIPNCYIESIRCVKKEENNS